MACLLQLPQTTSTACKVLKSMFFEPMYDLPNRNDTLSSAYPTTMKALLTLFDDDATSTTRRVAALPLLVKVLRLEGEDAILKVGTRLAELLAMDSNPTLQIAIARAIHIYHHTVRKKTLIMICAWTEILEVLIGLLVSRRNYDLRCSAGKTLLSFPASAILALKITIIPDALAKLFNFFVSDTTLYAISFIAGCILATLASVLEYRSKFRVLKDSVEGLGGILVTLGVTWRATHKTEDLENLEKRASVAAGILGNLALHEELKELIASLPGLEEGLLFLQVIQMTRSGTGTGNSNWYSPMTSTKALTILFLNPVNSSPRGIPTIGELEACLSDKGPPSKISWMAHTYANVYWTRVLVHLETRSYRAALENLDLAQNHSPAHQAVETSHGTGQHATPTFSHVRIFCLAMLKDHAGALLAINTMLGKGPWPKYVRVRRGIVKRLIGDLQGALDDFNLVVPSIMEDSREGACNALENRGYVKHLMGDDAGARQDAEAAQELLDNEEFERTIDYARLWLPEKQPINYLGHKFIGCLDITCRW